MLEALTAEGESFWPRLARRNGSSLSLGSPRGSLSLERECGGVAPAPRRAEPGTTRWHPASSTPAVPGEPRLCAGPRTLLPPVPLQDVRFHARGCNKLRERRAHSRDEGGQGSSYCGFLRFLPSWMGERAGAFPVPSQHEWITYLPAWPAPGGFPPRRARQPPRAQPRCSRAGARGTLGLVVLRGLAGRGV